MDAKPEDKQQPERQPEPPQYMVKPPIWSLFELLRKQPILLGAILGALAGLLAAGYFEFQTNMAVIGGAAAGLVIAAVIERLRSLRS